MSLSLPKKDYVAINIKDSSVSYPPSSKLYCNLCSFNLILLDAQSEEWICPHCDTSYFPSKEKVKRANKFDTPGPATDAHGNITGEKGPIVSMVDSDPYFNKSPKSKVPTSLRSLKERPGVNILSFSSSVDDESL